jgi:hypothetical protein
MAAKPPVEPFNHLLLVHFALNDVKNQILQGSTIIFASHRNKVIAASLNQKNQENKRCPLIAVYESVVGRHRLGKCCGFCSDASVITKIRARYGSLN